MNRILAISAAVAITLGSSAALGMGSGNKNKNAAESYTDAEKAVKAKQYRKAISMLEKIVAKNPKNVDALNYLGYSHRQLGEYDKSMGYYTKALAMNPNHRGANEYLGQLYLKLGKVKEAEAQLAKLKTICGSGCEEYDSLKAAIDKKKKGA
jgi:tetratricopeptide (TPR) repeat protein